MSILRGEGWLEWLEENDRAAGSERGVESCLEVSHVSDVRVPVCLTELRGSGFRTSASSAWLLRFPMPENMSVKLPPKFKEKSRSSSLGGIAVLA